MTVDANLLTKRATDDASGQPLTYPVRDLRIFLDALKRLGYNLASLTLSAGLKRFDLEDPDLRIPCEAFGALFGRAMQERPMKNLGVRMAAETTIGAFPLLDYLVVTSNTVGEGVKQLAHYFRLVGTPIHFDVREDEEPIRVIARAGNDTSLAIEFTVSLTVFNLRKEAGLHTAALRLELRALQAARRWTDIPPLLDQLVRRKVFDAAQAEHVRISAQSEQLKLLAQDAGAEQLEARLVADLHPPAGQQRQPARRAREQPFPGLPRRAASPRRRSACPPRCAPRDS